MKFRFETLLKVHKNRENLLQKQLGDILAHKQKQQSRQDLLKDARKNEIKLVNQRMTKDTSINTYVLYNKFFDGNYLQNNRQETIISEIDTRAEAKREELVEASRKRRTMEILKDRDLEQYRSKLAKMEIESMDEIASNHWSLNS
jgi:flagellar FliJ protein